MYTYFMYLYMRFSCASDNLFRSVLILFRIIGFPPFSCRDCIMEIIGIKTASSYFHISGNKRQKHCRRTVYHLYSESNRSVILISSAAAIASSWRSVGDVMPFSIVFSVDLLIPVRASSCFKVKCLSVRCLPR